MATDDDGSGLLRALHERAKELSCLYRVDTLLAPPLGRRWHATCQYALPIPNDGTRGSIIVLHGGFDRMHEFSIRYLSVDGAEYCRQQLLVLEHEAILRTLGRQMQRGAQTQKRVPSLS